MNKKAYYGAFGGQFVAESLMNTLEELDVAFEEAIHDPKFMEQYHYYLSQYVGRETPLYYAERLSEKYGTKIYLKREDLNHTGAHKINNVIGQILLAKLRIQFLGFFRQNFSVLSDNFYLWHRLLIFRKVSI